MPPPSAPPLPAAAHTTRDVIRATGPDTVGFLQGQLSQDLAAIGAGGSARSFVLRPDGKVDAWVRVHRPGEDEVVLDVDAGWGAHLVARLERFKLRTRCEVSLDEAVPTLALRGATLPDGLPCGWPGVDGSDLLGEAPTAPPPGDLPSGTVMLDAEGYDALRIVWGVPAMGAEITEATIPAELGRWLIDTSVSFTKGCFTGQELVARIDSRGGNVPRRLRGFTTEAAPPLPGAELVIEGEVVGRVTSAATGPGGPVVGLALVKRVVSPPATATVGALDGTGADLLLHELPGS